MGQQGGRCAGLQRRAPAWREARTRGTRAAVRGQAAAQQSKQRQQWRQNNRAAAAEPSVMGATGGRGGRWGRRVHATEGGTGGGGGGSPLLQTKQVSRAHVYTCITVLEPTNASIFLQPRSNLLRRNTNREIHVTNEDRQTR